MEGREGGKEGGREGKRRKGVRRKVFDQISMEAGNHTTANYYIHNYEV